MTRVVFLKLREKEQLLLLVVVVGAEDDSEGEPVLSAIDDSHRNTMRCYSVRA